MRYIHTQRRGNILVLSAFLMVVMIGVLAFALDLGYLQMAKTQLQRSADSAAIAGAWELMNAQASSHNSSTISLSNIYPVANTFSRLNEVAGQRASVAAKDVIVGRIASYQQPVALIVDGDAKKYNAVQVSVRRSEDMNGEIPLFFARIFGVQSKASQATATAVFLNSVKGFQVPSSGENLEILPFALDKTTWDALMSGHGSDNWTWNPETKTIQPGADGILEINLYPQGTGSPGNRGTVDIGSSNNSTADLARQIVHGVSAQDLSHIGGKLELNSEGKLYLNGDTGISAGVKDELASIRGEPRIIPIFSTVNGPGNNATYTIVQFAGVRIMDVNLTGSMSHKHVMIQPAPVRAKGVIPGDGTNTSSYVYSSVWLVR